MEVDDAVDRLVGAVLAGHALGDRADVVAQVLAPRGLDAAEDPHGGGGYRGAGRLRSAASLGVLARAAVLAGAAVEPVPAGVPVELVVAGPAVEGVHSRAARQPVVALVPRDGVLAGVTGEAVVARPPESLSLPAPPQMMSLPPSPLMASLPQPTITSARRVPLSRSLPDVPTIVAGLPPQRGTALAEPVGPPARPAGAAHAGADGPRARHPPRRNRPGTAPPPPRRRCPPPPRSCRRTGAPPPRPARSTRGRRPAPCRPVRTWSPAGLPAGSARPRTADHRCPPGPPSHWPGAPSHSQRRRRRSPRTSWSRRLASDRAARSPSAASMRNRAGRFPRPRRRSCTPDSRATADRVAPRASTPTVGQLAPLPTPVTGPWSLALRRRPRRRSGWGTSPPARRRRRG